MEDFEIFYRGNVGLVYGLMLARTRNASQAEDLTQETFLRAWRSFHDVATLGAEAQRAWLVRTARNVSIDVWRRQDLEARMSPEPRDVSGEEGAWDLRLDVMQALGELDECDRELVVMRYVEEMNSREIGEALGMPEGTVRRRLSRCREALAQHLSAWAPDGGVQ